MTAKPLPKLIEACGALQITCAKKLVAGSGFKTQLEEEIANAFAALNFAIEHLGLNRETIESRILKKLESMKRFEQIVSADNEFDLQPSWRKRKPSQAPVEGQGRPEVQGVPTPLETNSALLGGEFTP